MTNIDWRAFWTSFATIIIALIVFAIVVQPMIDKYKIKIVKPADAGTPTTPVTTPA